MYAREVEIVNPTGLHTRPGNAVVKRACEFKSKIAVVKGDRRGSAKSLLTLMKVGVSMGDKVTIEADGPDESEAAEAVATLISELKD